MEENTTLTQGQETGAETGGIEPTGTEPAGGTGKEQAKTYSEAELSAEADRRVSKALETAKANWEKDVAKRIAAERADAEKLAKMSVEERAAEEKKQQQAEYDRERAEFMRERAVFNTAKLLSSEGLPAEFAEMLAADSEEKTKAGIESFKDAFNKAVERSVEEKLKGKPFAGSGKDKPEPADPFLSGFTGI